MKKKKTTLIVIILIVLACIFIAASFIMINDKPEPLKYNVKIASIDVCKSDLCHYSSPQYIHYIEINTEDKKLQEAITKINNNTEKYAKESNDSNVDGNECSNVKDIYHHSKIIESQTYKLSNEKYFSVCVNRVIHNVCTEKEDVKEPDIINYSLSSKKFLTDEELLKEFEMTEENVNKGIQKELNTINKEAETNYKLSDIKDKKLYLDEEQKLIVTFYIPSLKMYLSAYVIK